MTRKTTIKLIRFGSAKRLTQGFAGGPNLESVDPTDRYKIGG